MRYADIEQAVFLCRPNRFVAEVLLGGEAVVCHVKNTGRMHELLLPGVVVYVQKSTNPNRRTPYTLIAAEKGERIINIDSSAPNVLFGEWLRKKDYFGKLTLIQPEKTFGASRFDYYLESESERIFVEVKGVTLEQDGHSFFPDAPTERGVKHLYELISCREQGYRAAVAFVVKMEGIDWFSPNEETHPAFGAALRAAQAAGVEILVIGCRVGADWMETAEMIPLRLA